MKRMRKFKWIWIFLQCSWGGLQTAVGLIMWMIFRNYPHYSFCGCIVTEWNLSWGISLGLFILIPNRFRNKIKFLAHEWGHSYQSFLLGPIFPLVGISSILWAVLPCSVKLRQQRGVPYDVFWTEKWANKIAARVLDINCDDIV